MGGRTKCYRCGGNIYTGSTNCEFLSLGGVPSDWDITRYAACVKVTVPMQDKKPKTMTPYGRTADGAGCSFTAHPQCYRLLLGIIGAAREDPDRAAAFEADHPTQRWSRQKAAEGVPEPELHVLPQIGEAQQRTVPSAAEKAVMLADEASTYAVASSASSVEGHVGGASSQLDSSSCATNHGAPLG